ncbi:MAG: ABC transporter permease [Candidatus Aminicenantaceae bacterium]
MFKNYFLTALRNIRKHKGYSFINIAGLAIGMACCILIIIFIMTELGYDKFHTKADRIHRLAIDATLGERIINMPVANNPAGPTLVRDYPEVENAVRIQPWRARTSLTYQDLQFYEDGIFWADQSFFSVFSFPLIKGDPETALQTANSMVLTESAAEKYFGTDDPMGKVLKANNQTDYTVTGVCRVVPQNSHFHFDMLASFETQFAQNRRMEDIWLNFNNYVYLLLSPEADPGALEAKFPALVEQYMGKDLKALGGTINFYLQPLRDIHLHSHLEGEIEGNGNILYVYIFAAIALFILIIACINFMNLATARSATRAREVSMRKVAGAHKGALIGQFLGETVLFSLIALAIALVLVWQALPYFSAISGIEMKIRPELLPWLIPTFFGLILFVGLAAGSYPALYLSSFEPAAVLKGSFKAGKAGSRFRGILVVGQFIVSIALIIGTSLVLNQLRYMKKKELGFDKSHVVVTQVRDRKMLQALDSIKAQLQQVPGVLAVTSSSIVPGGQPSISIFRPEGFADDESQIMEQYQVDEDFFPTMGIEVVQGRNFSKEFSTDPEQSVIINQAAAQKFGWEDPVGRTIRISGDINDENEILFEARTVVGVIADFHLASLHKMIAPQIVYNSSGSALSLRLSPENTSATLTRLKELWGTIDPGRPLDYFFLDESFDAQYRAEERLSGIFSSFTVFAIFIACLGLFGMASYMAEQRTKEIGIRKVLGASIPGVVALLARDFVKLVLIANLVAWPLAYFIMNRWMQNFAYRAGITIWIFFLTGLAAMTIALLTVSFQSIRAALSDPVRAIKYE